MVEAAVERQAEQEVGEGHTFNITLSHEEARALSVAAARRGLPRKHLAQDILRLFLREQDILDGYND